MIIYLFSTLLAVIISCLILTVTNILSLYPIIDRENITPFECGFDPNNSARLPFSTRFFVLAVIFLVFDIEIALLIPIPLSIHLNLSPSFLITATIFFLILLIGLIHEWNEGSLDWTN